MAKNEKSVASGSEILRKLTKIASIVFFLILFFLAWLDQSRSFYCFSNSKCLTIWKRLGNKCYVIPGKYYGIIKPSHYVETTNDNAITVIVDDTSEYDYMISNDYGKKIIISLLEGRIKYFEYTERDEFLDKFYINRRIKDDLNYLQIDIKESLVIINGVKQ